MNKRVWPITLFFHGDKLRYMRLFVFGCLLVFVFAFVYPYLLKWYTKAPAIAKMGQYGDVYGGLNTLFTGLAFIGLVVTILLQRQEMKETREIMTKQVLDVAMFEYLRYMQSIQNEDARKIVYNDIDEALKVIGDPIRSVGESESILQNEELSTLTQGINSLRQSLRSLAAWRRVYVSWCKRVEQELIITKENNEVILTYISSFWHMLSLEERFLLHIQMAFLADEHLHDWEDLNKSFGDNSAIRTAFVSREYTLHQEKLLLLLLAPKGKGSSDSVDLTGEQVESICRAYITRHENA